MFRNFHLSQRAAWVGSILTLFILATALVGYSLRTATNQEPTTPTEPITPAIAPVIATVTPEPEPDPEPEPEPTPTPTPEPEPMPEVTVSAPVVATATAPHIPVAPLQGEVLSVFSVAELVYNPTMDDWRIHDGIDIQAQQGTPVMATFAGTVVAVEDDTLMGTQVIIDHGDGYQTTYANLQDTPTVNEGDVVKTGAIIGAVGTTATAESAMAPHLHFSVSLNGDTIDPSAYLNP